LKTIVSKIQDKKPKEGVTSAKAEIPVENSPFALPQNEDRLDLLLYRFAGFVACKVLTLDTAIEFDFSPVIFKILKGSSIVII
jgi:hypothetical protein